MPGKKDCGSVSCNTHKQKRLILSNFNELYANFKSKYVSTSIVFQSSVNCGQSGVFLLYHLVLIQCVFLLAPLNVTYQELISLIVCDINNKKCVVHKCGNYPESNTRLQDFLFHTFQRSYFSHKVVTNLIVEAEA